VVFDSFTAKFILEALNEAQHSTSARKLSSYRGTNYTMADVREYSPVRANEMLGIYAKAKWNN